MKPGNPKSWWIIRIVTGLFLMGLIGSGFLLHAGFKWFQFSSKCMWCKENLCQLRGTLDIYPKYHHGQYPSIQTWCDDLIASEINKSIDRDMVCKAAAPAKCHYAINPHADPRNPKGLVWIFETTGGWNQNGGAGLLTPQNHEGKGANILFDGGDVEFVPACEFGKLRWSNPPQVESFSSNDQTSTQANPVLGSSKH